MSLTDLEAMVARDLAKIAHPQMPWVLPHAGPDGAPALDVLIVGAGQCGIAAAFGLIRSKIENILVIDEAPYGREGPWLTYARMHTLRSPKDFTGPDLDIPSLTYQSWHEANFGVESWENLGLIPKENWADYLLWVRRMIGVPVRNETRLVGLAQAGDLIAAEIIEQGQRRTLYARKIVLATGQESMGRWAMPQVLAGLPEDRRARACDAIDFARLKDKRVVVVGAGASAFDNAATALEAGAADVKLLCRRAELQVVQPYRWLTFRGFLRHFCELDDAWRWRFMTHILALREGFTQATYDRCMRHANFDIMTGAGIQSASMSGEDIVLETERGRIDADFVISAIGVDMDFSLRPELHGFAHNIETWGDRYAPPPDEQDRRLARFPYLGEDFALTERVPGGTPWISNIHVFSIASTLSFGPSGSSINAMTTMVPKLAAGIGRGLFQADIERYWQSLLAYDVKQAILYPRP
jgi:cation diffusion facilitator CzcD-associated flavoprotein CzcO